MSEYQYYEFQAIDRPLTRDEMEELRTFSSRARISSTRFANEYHFGSFKGDRRKWMQRYFDAHLYTSNFGSRVFCLRFPKGWIDPEMIAPYLVESALEVSTTGSHLILTFILDTEPGEYDEDEENGGVLADLLAIRGALAAGDHRALYIGWLAGVQNGLVDRDGLEPPVPAGLANRHDALDSLIGFLNLREDLMAAAAKNSPVPDAVPTADHIAEWLGGVAGNEKDVWLARFLSTDDPGLRREVMSRFRDASHAGPRESGSARTVEELLLIADALEIERLEKQRLDTERKERARIMTLAGQETAMWQSLIKLSESQSSRYQETAVHTLMDLRELAALTGATAEFNGKLEGLIELRRRKSAFMKRLMDAGLA